MKMFNTVRAPFSGRIDKILMTGADGTVVQKGQPLFKVTPDEKFVEVDPKVVEKERRARTAQHLKAVLMTFEEKFAQIEPIDVEVEDRAAAGVEAV